MGATAPPPKASHGDIAVVEIVDGGKIEAKVIDMNLSLALWPIL